MRGSDEQTQCLFSDVGCEARVPKDHPLRPIRAIVDEALQALWPRFQRLCAATGRPCVPPEKRLRALLLQAFSVRSERQLMEPFDDNLLFRHVRSFVAALRRERVTAHVAQNTSGRRSAIDGRTTRRAGYGVSQHMRKRIEEAFGWMKGPGTLRKARHRGTARVGFQFELTAAAYKLIRLPKLLGAVA